MRDTWIDVNFKLNAFLLKLEPHNGTHTLYGLPKLEELPEDGELVILQATHVQGILDHVLQVKGWVKNDSQIILGTRI